jgi:branched-chain amino acid transport system permease protein
LLIGIPALRVRGLYLAVTTLAFGGAMEFYVLKQKYWIGRHILPSGENHILRPVLWGRIDLSSDRSFYYVGLIFLGLSILAARAFRHNRSGRILIACRDNAKAAPAYGINLARTKLAGFAVSGGIAGLAGVLFAYNQGAVDASSYGIVPSITIFLVTVIGGISTLLGAVYGVVIIYASQFFLEPLILRHIHWLPTALAQHVDLLFTGPGLLLGLRFLPGGQAEFLFGNRDKFLRRVAAKHDILVPSLVADKRVEAKLEASVVSQAEHKVEEADSFDVVGHRTISCPVCHETLDVDAAFEHDHLRPSSIDSVGAGR